MNTQVIPSSASLLTNIPSGRDIHQAPAPYKPPSLDEDQLTRMRAHPDEHPPLNFGSDPDDSEEEALPVESRGPPGGFPDRRETASSAYY